MYDPARASLSTWLTLITRTIVREHANRKKLETVPLVSDDVARGSGHAPTLNHTPAVVFDSLTERQKLVLQMLFDQAMTVEQAAIRLGVDPQTIRSTKHKALS